MKLRVNDIVAATGGKLICGSLDAFVTGINTDTRIIKPGDLFAALKGEKSNGEEYIPIAIQKGASCVLSSSDTEFAVPSVQVQDTLTALGDIAKYYRAKFDPVVIAVTGSVGKTGTKEMIAAVVSAAGKTLKNEANFNNEIGLPLTLTKLDSSYDIAVTEMGMRGFGQIKYLCDIAKPKIGVITNIDVPHIELMGSLDNTAKAKGELLDCLPQDGTAVLNMDCDYFDYFKSRARCGIMSFGLNKKADVYAESFDIDENGCSVRAAVRGKMFEYRINAVGEHNVLNSLAAVCCGDILGISLADIKTRLEAFKTIKGRLDVIKSGGMTIIDDTYNAAPPSVISAIKTMFGMKGQRRVAYLGDMLELGDYAEELHKKVGKFAALNGVDLLVTVGELGEYIGDAAMENGLKNVMRFASSDDAAKYAAENAVAGDIVLVKGSHAVKMEKIVEALKNV